MSTAPTTTAAPKTPGFFERLGADLKTYLPVIEAGVNAGLLVSGLGAPFEPLAAQLEAAINPLVESIGTSSSTDTEVMAGYAATIGVLAVLKATTGLPADTLTKIEGYIEAAQDGTAGYVKGQSGFVAANYAPTTPIT
jgi:hypothetical protein